MRPRAIPPVALALASALALSMPAVAEGPPRARVQVELPTPPSLSALSTSILALADAPPPPASRPPAPLPDAVAGALSALETKETTLDAWTDARCAEVLSPVTLACRDGLATACTALFDLIDRESPHPCASVARLSEGVPPREAVSLRRCLEDAPGTCAEAANELDDDGTIVTFRLKTLLILRACASGNADACDALARHVATDPLRLLDKTVAFAPRRFACRLRGTAADRCARDWRPPSPARAVRPDAKRDALVFAVNSRSFGEVRRLAASKALANATDPDGMPLLAVAIRNDDALSAIALLKQGASPATIDEGIPALTLALHHGLDEVVTLLLAKKAPVAPKLKQPEFLPIRAAIAAGKPEVAARLVAAGADVPTDLLFARVQRGDVVGLLALLPKKADPGLLSSLLGRAVLADDETMALTLLGRGANARNQPQPLVRIALDRGESGLARALVEAGGDGTTARGEWPLVPAAALGDVSLVRAMVRQGAKVDAVDPRTRVTALASAVTAGQLDVLEFLLERSAPTDVTTREGEPVLLFALRTGQAAVVRQLLAARANPDVDWKGLRPLHVAAGRREPAMVEALLGAGASVDPVMEPTGATPLHLAAETGDVETLKRLLDAHAEPTRRTADGRTAHDLAVAGGHEAAALLLAPKSKAPAPSQKQPVP